MRNATENYIRAMEIGATEGQAFRRIKERLGIKKRESIARLLQKVVSQGEITYFVDAQKVEFKYKGAVFPFKIAHPYHPTKLLPKQLFLKTVLTKDHISEKPLYIGGKQVGRLYQSSKIIAA